MEGSLKLDLEDGMIWPFGRGVGWGVRMCPELGDQVRNREQSSTCPVVSHRSTEYSGGWQSRRYMLGVGVG